MKEDSEVSKVVYKPDEETQKLIDQIQQNDKDLLKDRKNDEDEK